MIGDKVKRLRHEKGLTQKELAKIVGISESTIKMIETNKNNPSLELLPKLANALEVDPAELLKEDKEDKINSFTMELLEKLLREGLIDDPNDIKKEELNLILTAVKMDLMRIKKDI